MAAKETQGLTRDLEAAKTAYGEGDAGASKAAHDGAKKATEEHSNTPSEFIKSMVRAPESPAAARLCTDTRQPPSLLRQPCLCRQLALPGHRRMLLRPLTAARSLTGWLACLGRC